MNSVHFWTSKWNFINVVGALSKAISLFQNHIDHLLFSIYVTDVDIFKSIPFAFALHIQNMTHVYLFVIAFLNHHKSQLHAILSLDLIWTHLKHD